MYRCSIGVVDRDEVFKDIKLRQFCLRVKKVRKVKMSFTNNSRAILINLIILFGLFQLILKEKNYDFENSIMKSSSLCSLAPPKFALTL